jgi:anti-sigma factor RsiW
MNCDQTKALLDAHLDGELDVVNSLQVDEHLGGCGACSARYRKLERLREEIAEADLEWRPRANLLKRSPAAWRKPALLVAAAAILALAVLVPLDIWRPDNALARQFLDDHLRALMTDHLVDVPSSDRHTVKPWFQGKLDFSPPVPDLSAQGFVLIGGRVDMIGGRKVAAIVYKRREHVITVFVSRGTDRPMPASVDGYHIVEWTADGMTLRAVSDLNIAELSQLASAMR